MEKVVYVLWKPEGTDSDAFRDRLLGELSQELHREGAAGLAIAVADSDVAAGEKLRLDGGLAHKDATVTFWLEQSQEVGACERRIEAMADRVAGYLVAESRPVVNRTHRAPLGERTPGFLLCTAITAKPGLDKAGFIELWHGEHRDVAIETQSSFAYQRNEIVRPLTPDAPGWDGIVEEFFPVEALDDQEHFYDAKGDPAKFDRHLKRMVDSCVAFLDMPKVSSHPMSQYVFEDLR